MSAATAQPVWTCEEHGLQPEPLMVGNYAYCANDDCTRQVVRVGADRSATSVPPTIDPVVVMTTLAAANKPPRSDRRPALNRDVTIAGVVAATQKLGRPATTREIAPFALPADTLADNYERPVALDALRVQLGRLADEGILVASYRPLFKFGKRKVRAFELAKHLKT